jgi:RNA polymerase sigma-70 factor (ECF subfamily)
MDQEDEDLVGLCQEGDLSAFEELVKRYQPRILAFLQKQVGLREDAEDITQRTFLQVYQSLSRFHPDHRFSSWIFTIARRQGIDFLRQAGSRRKTQNRLEAEPSPDNASDPSVLLKQKENLDQIWRWISKTLDARSSEILWLSIQEGLTVAEIARVMKLTRGHVKVLLFRARRQLHRKMASPPPSLSRHSSSWSASTH